MVSANKIEILRIAESVAQEKMIDKTIVIAALEEAIAKAAKSNYGEENEVIVEINQENGDISISRKIIVKPKISANSGRLDNCFKNIFFNFRFLNFIRSNIIRFITKKITSKPIIATIGWIKSASYSFNAIG